MSKLKLLARAAKAELTPAFLEGTAGVDVTKHLDDFERSVELEPLRRMIAEAQTKFEGTGPETSDGWLASRVHATLRLTRREAADQRLWTYLTVVEFPDYVRWRWGPEPALARFAGSETNQAIARLWWGAELARNGSDYSLVETAFEAQDIPNTWFRLDAFHHRPAAIAALQVIKGLNSQPLPNGKAVKRTKKINMLATALNTSLTTTVLDAVAPWRGEDADAMREWISGDVDETLMLEELPSGPDDEPAPNAEIEAVETLLEGIAVGAGIVPLGGDAGSPEEQPGDGPGDTAEAASAPLTPGS